MSSGRRLDETENGGVILYGRNLWLNQGLPGVEPYKVVIVESSDADDARRESRMKSLIRLLGSGIFWILGANAALPAEITLHR